VEPFALDLWRDDVTAWTPPLSHSQVTVRRFFGGLYQMVVVNVG
jgi:hypothetical protein